MRPALWGIVNVTPDSFSDGGSFADSLAAADHALRLLDEGAEVVDVGGESTRPGAAPVAAADEIVRTAPVIAAIARRAPGARISIDTSKAEVARAALSAGATIVNDVTALQDPQMASACAAAGCFVALMHMRGNPRSMQLDTQYADLEGEVVAFLADRAQRAIAAGIRPERLLVDPGLGFGKTPEANFRLIRAIPKLAALGFPVLIGASRKSFVGKASGVEHAADRVYGSIGAALAATRHGASALRVHDVAATRQALDVFCAAERA